MPLAAALPLLAPALDHHLASIGSKRSLRFRAGRCVHRQHGSSYMDPFVCLHVSQEPLIASTPSLAWPRRAKSCPAPSYRESQKS